MAPRSSPPLLAGKYRIEGLLGQGGMGTVFQAVNTAIGRRVAIKTLDARLATDQQFMRRFELEARAAAMINHPGVVDVLDRGTSEKGEPFIVMEYLEGATLRSVVKQLGRLSPGEAVFVACAILDALAAAHQAGVIHRDLKPANIFICTAPTEQVKILDFGISRFGSGSGLTQTGTTMGTPAYMSPEQVRGEKAVGPQSDLYSVGAMLYNMVTGVPPHEADSDIAVVAKVLTEPVQPLLSRRDDVGPGLSAVVDRLLAKAPGERPADAKTVASSLSSMVKVERGRVFSAARACVAQGASGSMKARTVGGPLATPQAVEEEEEVETPEGATRTAPPVPPSMSAVKVMGLLLGLALVSLAAVMTYLAMRPAPPPVVVTPAPVAVPAPPEPVPVQVQPTVVEGAQPAAAVEPAPAVAEPVPAPAAAKPKPSGTKKPKPAGGLSLEEKNPYQ